MALKDFVFADCEPMIIEFNNEKWINPFIKDWYKPTDNGYDDNIYRVYFSNSKKETVYIYFKSTYLDEKINAFFSQPDWEKQSNQTIFKDPFINVSLIYEGLRLTLLEDVWGPMPPAGVPFYPNKEFMDWISTGLESNQFCFSDFGGKINKFFKHDAAPSFFSLDCGLTTDGSDWWCDS